MTNEELDDCLLRGVRRQSLMDAATLAQLTVPGLVSDVGRRRHYRRVVARLKVLEARGLVLLIQTAEPHGLWSSLWAGDSPDRKAERERTVRVAEEVERALRGVHR